MKFLKNLILGQFGSFWPKQDFSQKIIRVNCKILFYCNFMQKIRKIPSVNFLQNLKNLIESILEPQNIFFEKIGLRHFIRYMTPELRAKNQRIPIGESGEKL